MTLFLDFLLFTYEQTFAFKKQNKVFSDLQIAKLKKRKAKRGTVVSKKKKKKNLQA